MTTLNSQNPIIFHIQIFFSSPNDGCVQWHTGLTGQFKTFNFANAAGPHLPNQKYFKLLDISPIPIIAI